MTPDPARVIEAVDIDRRSPSPRSPTRSTPSKPPPPLALVVFGASGDLAARKLLPALAALADTGPLPDGFTVVGVARTEWTDDEFRQAAARRRDPTPGPEWKRARGAVPLRGRRVRREPRPSTS